MKNFLICAAFAACCSAAYSQRVSTTVLLSPAFATSAGPLGNSGAVGVVDVTMDMDAKTILLRARLLGLRTAVTMAHFHGAADIGETRPPVAGAAIDTTTWTSAAGQLITAVPDATLNLILTGQTYLNVHTSAYGGGELSGPVAFEGVGIAHLMPSQETDRTNLATSVRYGVGIVKMQGSTLTGSVVSTGFASGEVTAMHIHGPADIGGNAGVWCNIATTASQGTLRNFTCPAVDATVRANLLTGLYYFNVHTSVAPAGEIRGQIVFPSTLDGGRVYFANITAAGVVGRAATDSNGTGTGLILFYKGSNSRGVAVLSATGLRGNMTNSHVHGPGAPVMFQLPQVQPAYAYQPFNVTAAQAAALVAGTQDATAAYFNVHTTFAVGGEINGYIQLLPNPPRPNSGAAAPVPSIAVALVTAAVALFAAVNSA